MRVPQRLNEMYYQRMYTPSSLNASHDVNLLPIPSESWCRHTRHTKPTEHVGEEAQRNV